ncbi:MAG: Zn-dependent hydrolase [Bulleidia sp.]
MKEEMEISYCTELFQIFEPVGALEDGGVTRLGYTETEDQMHHLFCEEAGKLGLHVFSDEAGNDFAENTPGDAVLIGSHLDSVIDGGRYDGVSGVIAGLMIAKRAKEEGFPIPLRIAAWRCEESSRFGCATIGSSLVTGHQESNRLSDLKDVNGITLGQIFQERGYSLHPQRIRNVLQYLELHIEQGRSLESRNLKAGIVTGIAAPHRWNADIIGMADHSGATPMDLRADSLAAAAELILAAEQIGRNEPDSVATVGVIHNEPNVMNVVPGNTRIGIDLRSARRNHLDRMDELLKQKAGKIAEERGLKIVLSPISRAEPVTLDSGAEQGLMNAADKLGIPAQYMISGAGHDAMMLADLVPTGMVFIPCVKGISHNRMEKADLSDVCRGAEIMYEYLKGLEYAD